jgi:aryl-alcohol dehydrogenase-like predicted oxidoreductase
MELRRILGSDRETSVIGLSLDSLWTAIHPAEHVARRLLSIAQEAGARLIDTADSVHPKRTEAMLGRIDRFEPGTLWMLERSPSALGIDPASRHLDRGDAGIETRLRRSLAELPVRPDLARWVQWRGSAAHPNWNDEATGCLRELQRAGEIAGWSLRPTAVPDPTSVPAGVAQSGEVSLLNRTWAGFLRTSERAASFFARDPVAAGRLDGTRWARILQVTGAPGAPTPLRRWQEEVAPVLEFGFLTEGHRRTLAQAALQYVAGLPGVASVLVPLPPAERLAEFFAFANAPDLSEAESARISRLTELGPPAPGPGRLEHAGPWSER